MVLQELASRIASALVAAYERWALAVQPVVLSKVFLSALILLQAGEVAFLASRHDPRFSFDESNTLRISKLPCDQLSEVLANEQNFTLYYRLLHEVFNSLGAPDALAIWFNYACWCAAILVFHRIAGKLFASPSWQYFATLLYAATPSIFYFAFYVRMYALCNLAFLAALLFLLKYYERQQLRHLAAHGATLVLITFLHPTAAAMGVIFWIAHLVTLRDKRLIAFVSSFAILGAIILLAQAFEKVDPIAIYFGTGIQYIKASTEAFFNVPSHLFFRSFHSLSWVFYLLVAASIAGYVRSGQAFTRRNFVFTAFSGVLAVLHISVKGFANAHHYYFFVAPLLLVMVLGLEQLSGRRSVLRIMVPLTALIFGTGGWTYLHSHVSFERSWQDLSRAMSELDPGLILTDYTMSNTVEQGAPPGKHKMVLHSQGRLFDTMGLSVKEMLIAQAKMGGTATPGMAIHAFRNTLRGLTPGAREELRRGLETFAEGRANLYYVTSFNRLELFPEELELLNRYRFMERKKPAIFCFRRD